MMRRITYLLVAAFVCTVSSNAQGGSNYSALGLGDLRPSIGAMYDAMGGTTIAMPTPYGINVVNPALVGMATTTRIQAGYRFNQHVINSPDGRRQSQNNGELDGLIAMFSVDTAYGYGFTFGLLPYSSVAYAVKRDLSSELDGRTFTGESNQTGTGGASLLHLSSSVKLLPKLHIGVAINAMFGVIDYRDAVTVDGPFNNVVSSQTYDIRGFLFRGGLYYQPTNWLNIGLFAAGGTDATVFITRRAVGVGAAGSTFDSTEIVRSETAMPRHFGIGISTPLGRGLIGADVEIGDFSGVTVNVRDDAGYSTGIRTSLGLTVPGTQRPTASWFNKIGYHAGLSFNRVYVTYKAEKVNEYFVSGGISTPLGGHAMVDFGLQLGARQPAANKSINELVGRLTVTVSIGETWFQPFSRDQ